MADGRSSASVVAVDPEKAARERDEAARALLRDSPLQTHLQYMTNGLELTVPFTLKVVAEAVAFSRAKEVADEVLRSAWHLADTVLNNFNPNSEISMIGRLPVGQKHTMSATLKSVITCCQHVFNSSRGVFDPATGPIIEALRAKVAEKASVSDEQMEKLFRVCNFPSSFSVDLEMGTIARKHEDARFDLGGVSKGYIVDYVVERLNAAGIVDVYFEWGGDCRASGTNARRTPWMVGIIRPPSMEQLRNPPKDPSYIRVLPLNDEALCTSGDYENLTEGSNKKLYTSIFDWKKKDLLEPVESELAQVSIKCYSAMYADALATASLIKRDIKKVRQMLEEWRHVRNRVTNYVTYTRQGERVARMFEIATDNAEIRKKRIAGSLPARVIVVGGGLAGLSAAIEATACGAQVILLEKEPRVGGNSAKATSGINGWGTRAQAEQDVYDSGKYFERDTHKSGLGGSTDPGLVRTLSVKSGDAISWLSSLGVPLTVLSQLGGHSRKRTHRAPDKADGTPVPIGFTIMQTLEQHVRTKLADRVTIMENTTVTSLLSKSRVRHDGAKQVRVYGVEVLQDEGVASRILADAVILATGGFSNDKTPNSLLQEFAPQLSGFPTTNGPWATGDGVKLARELGVKLVDMDKVQLHPTGLIDPKDPANPTKYLGPEALRGSGGVLLNKKGERFVNELDLRSVVSNAIIEQGDEYPDSGGSKFAFCVLNDAAVRLFGVNSHGFYWNRLGLFVKADTVEKLAALIGCPVENVRNTLGDYEQLSKENRQCPKTRKIVYPCVVGPQGPFYVAFVTPSIHYTMGGCLISPSAEMQLEENTTSPFGHRRPIFGLFGAGEVTGGVHGGNRLGGNSLLECVVFGRIAGDRAATILQNNDTYLWGEKWSQLKLRNVVEEENGFMWLHFTFPSSFQVSGLEVLQGVVLRSVSGDKSVEVYTPYTLPDDEGVVGIALSPLLTGNGVHWLRTLQPGDTVEMKAAERVDRGYMNMLNAPHKVVIATSRGIAPMMQILRAAMEGPEKDTTIHLIYIADRASSIPHREKLKALAEASPERFRCTFVLQHPQPGWSGAVNYVDEVAASVFPDPALVIFLCGASEETRSIKSSLLDMGHDVATIATVE